ncbi:MAG: hypothetical protein ACLUGQ_08780 [Coprococcus sp.]
MISENTASIFKENKINDIAFAKAGIVTGDDKKFLRIWYEIANEEIDFTCEEYEYNPKVRWVPMNKGGSYRKYYGNYEFVMNIYRFMDRWENESHLFEGAILIHISKKQSHGQW